MKNPETEEARMLAAEIVTLRKAAGALGEALARIDTLEAALWGARRAHAAKCELRPGRACTCTAGEHNAKIVAALARPLGGGS